MGNIGPDIPLWLLGLILAPIWAMPSLLAGFVTGLVVRRVGYGVRIGTGYGVLIGTGFGVLATAGVTGSLTVVPSDLRLEVFIATLTLTPLGTIFVTGATAILQGTRDQPPS